jgi:predicted nucleic-acid-binding protein
MEAIIGSLGLLFLGLVLGYFRGVESQTNIIRSAFEIEEKYTYGEFDKVLEKHEERKAGWKAKASLDKRRKKHNNKKNHSN